MALGYNSSASVTNAIFLIFNLYFINSLRAARPAFGIPSIGYNIFCCVGFVYGPQEATQVRSVRFTKELLYAFLTGHAISCGVSLFVLPVSSRKVFFAETVGFLQTSRRLLKAQLSFVDAMQHWNIEGEYIHLEASDQAAKKVQYMKSVGAMKGATAGLLGLGSKLREDVIFAKREVAYGHLGSGPVNELYEHLRAIMIPLSSLSSISDISARLNGQARSKKSDQEPRFSESGVTLQQQDPQKVAEESKKWQEMVQALHESFEAIIQVLDEAVAHTLILLKLIPKSSTPANSGSNSVDVETAMDAARPGDIGFGDYLDRQVQEFRRLRTIRLQDWASENGLSSVLHSSSKNGYSDPIEHQNQYSKSLSSEESRAAKQLQLVLYMEYLLYNVSKAILGLVRWVETLAKEGIMDKKRIIFPPAKILRKWFRGIIDGADSTPDIDNFIDTAESTPIVYLGDSLKGKKDAEHLPPKNRSQVWGDRIRKIPVVLGSAPSKFGARVTIAVMSIGIMAYLRQTHPFFIRERVVWTLVMTAIGMNPTSGSAVFNLLTNLVSTLAAMILSYVNWYIVDQKSAGVIVFLFLMLMIYFYFLSKKPQFTVALISGAITHVLIIGKHNDIRSIPVDFAD